MACLVRTAAAREVAEAVVGVEERGPTKNQEG